MEIKLPEGVYVVAVSGGVDSAVLLDILVKQGGRLDLIVAHFDHGIREDSHEDLELVQSLAEKHGLSFVYKQAKLGSNTSEELARVKRYDFLSEVKSTYQAAAIITAHHQDDLLETAVFNLLRGTGRKGLASLRSRKDIVRPLLHVTKQDILSYARQNDLRWREDSTNQDDAYMRNYIRHNIVPMFSAKDKDMLLQIIRSSESINDQIEPLLENIIKQNSTKQGMNRIWFNSLPHSIATEVLIKWLADFGITSLDRKSLTRMVVQSKTLQPGKAINVVREYNLRVFKQTLALETLDR